MRTRAKLCSALAAVALGAVVVPASGASAAEEFEKYAIESGSVSLASNQAGAHADLTLGISLTENGGNPYAPTRNLEFKLPPGLIGNPQAVPRCSIEDLGNQSPESKCPFASQIGIVEVKLGGILNNTFVEPIYNMVPPNNEDSVARFGFFAEPNAPAFVNVRVDPSDYSVVSAVEGIPSVANLVRATSRIWAIPADPIHDLDRLTPEEAEHFEKPLGGRSIEEPEAPFLTNPTNCEAPRPLVITATSYPLPESPSIKEVPFPQMGGCGKLAFEPQFTAVPTNPEAFAPTGIDTELTMPQNETPKGRATSTLRSAVVMLPQGFTINAAAGDGQEACSSEEVGFGQNKPAACPSAAKIGSIEADVPALGKPLHGSVYLRTPEPGHLFRFWLAADEQGVHLKLPAEVELDHTTGQVTTVVAGLASLGGLPQVPVADLKVHISGGPRAPIATPGCGTYQTSYSFTPWSGTPAVVGKTPMQITTGCNKGGFSPGLIAGTLNPGAGEFSPFTMTLTRSDGEGNPQTLALHLPQGLLAKLGGVALCPDAAAPSGACPAASRIGSLTAAAGVGGAPLWIPQPGKDPTAVYLAGPYKGAPYSVVSVVPAQAGPFDLGLVVNRAAIHIDPKTARATIVTDPLPQMLEGVPVSYRTIHVEADRHDFTLNPTSCAQKQISATLTATDGRLAEPHAGFQATDCASLGFKPSLSLRLAGGTKRGDNPALTGIYRPRKGDANLKGLVLRLPHSAFLEQGHIRTICTRVQYAASGGNGGGCPKGAVYGHATAYTPILDEPLEGPVYLRSSSHNLPDFVVALHGLVDVEAVARIDSVNGGIRASFSGVPDAPLTKVVVHMQGQKKGLIVNSTDLCAAAHRGKAEFEGQNGRELSSRPVMGASCGGKGKHKRHRG